MYEDVCLARSEALRMAALTSWKVVLIYRKSVETLSVSLWRVLILCLRERQVSKP